MSIQIFLSFFFPARFIVGRPPACRDTARQKQNEYLLEIGEVSCKDMLTNRKLQNFLTSFESAPKVKRRFLLIENS